MQKPKLDVLVAFLTFGGNGGVSTIIPSHSDWLAETALKAKADDRVGRFEWKRFGDIPLDVERNKIVQYAKTKKFDVLIMLDSDNFVDKYVGVDPEAKPFWDSSFDFLYERALRGIPTVVCCPYCGPPPDDVTGGAENVYVFYFSDFETQAEGSPRGAIRLEAYSRTHAATMRGIQEIGAGPTGVIMYSIDAFDLFPPITPPEKILQMHKAGELGTERAIQLLNRQSWFFYETNPLRTEKQSTEDVTNTREIQLAGKVKFKQSVVFCNWDSWAGHWKPKCVGRPRPLPIEAVSQMFQDAVHDNHSLHDRAIEVDYSDGFDFSNAPVMGAEEPVTVSLEDPMQGGVLFGVRVPKLWHDKDVLEALNKEMRSDVFKKILVVGDHSAHVAWACAAGRPYITVYYSDKEFHPVHPEPRRHGQLMRTDHAVDGLYEAWQEVDEVVCCGASSPSAAILMNRFVESRVANSGAILRTLSPVLSINERAEELGIEYETIDGKLTTYKARV